eukprot:488734-Rhodomonas_salina.1
MPYDSVTGIGHGLFLKLRHTEGPGCHSDALGFRVSRLDSSFLLVVADVAASLSLSAVFSSDRSVPSRVPQRFKGNYPGKAVFLLGPVSKYFLSQYFRSTSRFSTSAVLYLLVYYPGTDHTHNNTKSYETETTRTILSPPTLTATAGW